jgi:2-amino-4-hydroxy-6-hydroxymethyldihydropteridine diphosphokinase
MAAATYVVALGSNRRGRHGDPRREVAAALRVLNPAATSRTVTSAPLGPSNRRYANAVAIVESRLAPDDFLARLQQVERDFGRRRARRWGARVIDLDIILWSGGSWAGPGLIVPHVAFRARGFVLAPLVEIAPGWRDPISRLTVRQLHARLTRTRPLPNRHRGSGP